MTARVVGFSSASRLIVGPEFGVRQLAKDIFRVHSGTDDVVRRECWTGSQLCKKIPAQQGAGRLFVENARFPAVGHVRGVDVTNSMLAEVDDLTIGKWHRCSVGEIVE
jgi:hypothetical protein